MNEAHLQEELTAKQRLLADQREANQKLVLAALRAEQQSEQAEAARERAEALANELRASQDRYRTLFELCPAGVYVCDSQGVIQDFNHQAALLWGRAPSRGDANERYCGSFKLVRTDGSFLPHDQCPMADVLEGKVCGVTEQEILMRRPDGSTVTVLVTIRPLLNDRGQRLGAINCFHDITARKTAEDQVADSLQRERELAGFRELFMGILGHDLRNPLSSIMLAAGALLRRGHLAEHDGVAVARILRSSQRMSRMIEKLLDFTRARIGGGLSIDAKRVDLRELCEDVVEEFDASVELIVHGDLRGTWDPDRLAQALSNLIGNAVRFARAGTDVVVTARAEGPLVLVEVTNQGPPIAPEVLPFIFEPFRGAHDPHKQTIKQPGNLGLGLYIAHQIAVAHEGSLAGYSADGTTTFAMRLPRERGNDPVA